MNPRRLIAETVAATTLLGGVGLVAEGALHANLAQAIGQTCLDAAKGSLDPGDFVAAGTSVAVIQTALGEKPNTPYTQTTCDEIFDWAKANGVIHEGTTVLKVGPIVLNGILAHPVKPGASKTNPTVPTKPVKTPNPNACAKPEEDIFPRMEVDYGSNSIRLYDKQGVLIRSESYPTDNGRALQGLINLSGCIDPGDNVKEYIGRPSHFNNPAYDSNVDTSSPYGDGDPTTRDLQLNYYVRFAPAAGIAGQYGIPSWAAGLGFHEIPIASRDGKNIKAGQHIPSTGLDSSGGCFRELPADAAFNYGFLRQYASSVAIIIRNNQAVPAKHGRS